MSTDPRRSLEAAIAGKRILVVCGSGGVGKTTTAAALGLRAALAGRHVLVCTIDPSRRLATSLGLNQLSEKPRTIALGKAAPEASGALSAMMLDTKRTFDALVERFAPSPEAARRILANRFYQEGSNALAGSHEYMAMEKLLELSTDTRFDLIVLDTPPTRHALDFLEAPDRMLAFLDTSVLRFFLKPYFSAGRLTLKVATKTGRIALDLADRLLGLQFLKDTSEFFLAFDGMYDGFKQRADRVHALLRDKGSGFLLVSSPSRQSLEEARYFHARLEEKEMPFLSFVVNRTHLHPAARRARRVATEAGGGAAPALERDLAERLIALHRDLQTLGRVERAAIARLEVDAGGPIVLVPEFEGDVHDLRGLRDVANMLVPPGAARAARAEAR
jgi:anion-transporting  ArsA/GET3 family ATPase